MKKTIVACMIGLAILTPPAGAAISLSGGSLSGTAGTLTATDGWNGGSITWSVQDNGGGTWDYQYTLTVPSGKNSHPLNYMILQVSDSFTSGDFWDLTGALASGGPASYPVTGTGMPSPLYGLKLLPLGTGVRSWTIDFTSDYAPAWGDFYAEDGVYGNNQLVYMYNTDFGGGTGVSKIAIPGVVPLPASILLGVFAVGLAARKLRRFV